MTNKQNSLPEPHSDKSRYLQTPLSRLFAVLNEKGFVHVATFLFHHVLAYPIFWYHRAFSQKKISFDGADLSYFYHPHNHTWLNERMIEVPLILYLWQRCRLENKCILEVGNVLSHYFPIQHDVVDKYEIAPGVINEDITKFQPSRRYDLIISISTLEHVGWDELPQRPEKVLEAITHLKSLLNPKGEIYITLPIGENPYLDEYLREGRIQFDEQYNFIRIGRMEWRQTDWQNIAFAQHNKPFRFGNAVIVGHIHG
jgi:Methyltransferase domain